MRIDKFIRKEKGQLDGFRLWWSKQKHLKEYNPDKTYEQWIEEYVLYYSKEEVDEVE